MPTAPDEKLGADGGSVLTICNFTEPPLVTMVACVFAASEPLSMTGFVLNAPELPLTL